MISRDHFQKVWRLKEYVSMQGQVLQHFEIASGRKMWHVLTLHIDNLKKRKKHVGPQTSNVVVFFVKRNAATFKPLKSSADICQVPLCRLGRMDKAIIHMAER